MSIFEKNHSIYINELRADGFAEWLFRKVVTGERGVAPFDIPVRVDFEDILKGIFNRLKGHEQAALQNAFAIAASRWSVKEHGVNRLRYLYELGNVVGSVGVYVESVIKLSEWLPDSSDYYLIIEYGKLMNEVMIGIKGGGPKIIEQTTFMPVLRLLRKLFEEDEEEKLKYIYSPLFRLACMANYEEWPFLASLLAKRYPLSLSDFWPDKYARYCNYKGEKGYFDLRQTIVDLFKSMVGSMSIDECDIIRGCASLMNKHYSVDRGAMFYELLYNKIISYKKDFISEEPRVELILEEGYFTRKRECGIYLNESMPMDVFDELRDVEIMRLFEGGFSSLDEAKMLIK
jgi:hypothetical protein